MEISALYAARPCAHAGANARGPAPSKAQQRSAARKGNCECRSGRGGAARRCTRVHARITPAHPPRARRCVCTPAHLHPDGTNRARAPVAGRPAAAVRDWRCRLTSRARRADRRFGFRVRIHIRIHIRGHWSELCTGGSKAQSYGDLRMIITARLRAGWSGYTDSGRGHSDNEVWSFH